MVTELSVYTEKWKAKSWTALRGHLSFHSLQLLHHLLLEEVLSRMKLTFKKCEVIRKYIVFSANGSGSSREWTWGKAQTLQSLSLSRSLCQQQQPRSPRRDAPKGPLFFSLALLWSTDSSHVRILDWHYANGDGEVMPCQEELPFRPQNELVGFGPHCRCFHRYACPQNSSNSWFSWFELWRNMYYRNLTQSRSDALETISIGGICLTESQHWLIAHHLALGKRKWSVHVDPQDSSVFSYFT